VAAVVARLEEQKSQLQVQRAALLGYLVPGHPQVELLSHQLAALERQIARERARLAAPGGRQLNRTIETFQQLQAQATFAQDLYRAALTALEKGQVEAQRTLKKVSVLQAPRRPEYPLQPHRLYNASVLFVAVALLAGVLQLLAAIVRDHRD
jgi:capsular polysaccharide transport system permease protein